MRNVWYGRGNHKPVPRSRHNKDTELQWEIFMNAQDRAFREYFRYWAIFVDQNKTFTDKTFANLVYNSRNFSRKIFPMHCTCIRTRYHAIQSGDRILSCAVLMSSINLYQILVAKQYNVSLITIETEPGPHVPFHYHQVHTCTHIAHINPLPMPFIYLHCIFSKTSVSQ